MNIQNITESVIAQYEALKAAEAPTAPTPAKNPALQAFHLRIKALYHNCMSASCFCSEDAEKAEMSHDETEALAKRRESSAYSTVAGWLFNATK